jgi:hypothetical protein
MLPLKKNAGVVGTLSLWARCGAEAVAIQLKKRIRGSFSGNAEDFPAIFRQGIYLALNLGVGPFEKFVFGHDRADYTPTIVQTDALPRARADCAVPPRMLS